jgi:S1-C subfamily serine protease
MLSLGRRCLVLLSTAPLLLAQASPAPVKAKSPSTVLSGEEIHDTARSVAVLVTERTPDGDTRHLGSGVWVKEGLVATCWHVVSNVHGALKISVGAGDVLTGGGLVFQGLFKDYAAKVVASDPGSDLAILSTEQNPFTDAGALIRTPTQVIRPRLAVAKASQKVPAAGTGTVLAGYPMKGFDLISQTRNIAGSSVLPPAALVEGSVSALKGIRILVSVVSNPGNSGGPVLDDRGDLIGLLEGNLQSPLRDETGAPVVYLRPKKDPSGAMLRDERGAPQLELANMSQNSGVSVVVPVSLLVPLLIQAESTR